MLLFCNLPLFVLSYKIVKNWLTVHCIKNLYIKISLCDINAFKHETTRHSSSSILELFPCQLIRVLIIICRSCGTLAFVFLETLFSWEIQTVRSYHSWRNLDRYPYRHSLLDFRCKKWRQRWFRAHLYWAKANFFQKKDLYVLERKRKRHCF